MFSYYHLLISLYYTADLMQIFLQRVCPILTAAEGFILGVGAKMFSCCGARHIPCRRSGFVICRPLPLAQVASSATGGAPIAPHRRPGDRVRCECQRIVRPDLLDNNVIITGGYGHPPPLTDAIKAGVGSYGSMPTMNRKKA